MKEVYTVSVKGLAPLLQNRFSGEQNSRQTRRTGQVYDNEAMARNALYTNEKEEVIQPAIHFESAMIKAATNFRFQGKKTFKDLFKSAVFVEPEQIVHGNQEWTIDERPVVVNRSRIIRARPRLDDWHLEFQVIVTDERVSGNILKDVLTEAGMYYGIGDYRPRCGRFEIVSFDRHEESV